MIAPGHRPDMHAARNADALKQARDLIAAGKVGDTVGIVDFNQGQWIDRTLPAAVALSYFDGDGPAVMRIATAGLQAGTPVMMIIGEQDRFHPKAREQVFDRQPAHPKNVYTVVPGGDKATPMKGKKEIAAWLGGL
ncbi:MAG: hypothetical protein VW405_19185 [Rhodospirillaceae bacterium]